jgi:hypothetical protein
MRTLAVLLLCLLGLSLSWAQQSARVPADGRITLTDYGYRDWAPDLLHYTVDTKAFKPGKVTLSDETGTPVPCQIDGTTLTFTAALPKGKTVSYTLASGKASKLAGASAWTEKDGKAMILANAAVAVLVPAPGKLAPKAPVPAASVPGPLLGWTAENDHWLGGSRFVTDRKVSGATFTLLKRGPAYVEYEARYQFVPKGEYVCRVVVAAGLDRAEVTEEFDFGSVTKGQDFLLLTLQKGFTPATIGIMTGGGEAQGQGISRKPLADYLAPKLKSGANPPAPVGGSGATPMPPVPEAGMTLLEKIVAGGKWGGLIGGVELRDNAEKDQVPAAREAVVPLHVGSWRRAMALTLWQHPQDGVTVALPISVRHITWYNETTDDVSPFSSHEHDEGLAVSYGRRQWALDFSTTPNKTQETAGYIGLDTYKDWILDWPETTTAADYPRAMYTKADVARLKKALAQHPDHDALAKFYVISGDAKDAVAHAQQAISGTIGQMGYLGNWYVPGLSHYRQSQGFGSITAVADDALACPALAAEQRATLRRTLAFGAYMMAEPDLNPRGVGVHLGNNNMSINRTCPLLAFAGLLPDHPRYKYWMQQGTDFVRFKLATHNAWDGTNLECPTYQLYGPMRFLDEALTIIHNTGGPDFAPYVAANVTYLANLTMPDARVDGRRLIPGMGNSSNVLESIFGVTLNSVERANPALAAKMQFIEKQCYANEPLANLVNNDGNYGTVWNYRPDIAPKDAGLTTTFLPTYGVVFRAHYGSPDETAMLFRAGINWGHWDTDALNTILYGKGAPLSPGTGYQYYWGAGSQDEIIYHNRVKVGAYHQPEIFGRVDTAITDYGFGPSADYAVASRYYPAEVFADKKGEMRWNRHVLFVKSATPAGANYFVMRDTFPGGEGRPTWWTWMNLDGAEKVSVDGAAFDPKAVPFNKLDEAAMPAKTGRSLEMKTAYGAGTGFWFAGDPLTIRARMTWDYSQGGRLRMPNDWFPKFTPKETKTTIEAIAKPGADYYYVVYPHKDNEAMPPCTDMGNGGLKISTPEATDYVFVSDTPLTFNDENVVFTGKAGAVRVYADRVTLCLNSGHGTVGYKGAIFEGDGPFERTVKLADLKAGVVQVGGTPKTPQTVAAGEVTVRGEGPFTAVQDGQAIKISVDGRARVLFVSKPEWMWRPQYWIDGVEWMPCWTDYPSSGWGTYKDTNLVAIAVPDGKHELILKNLVFPPSWERKFTPAIAGVVK